MKKILLAFLVCIDALATSAQWSNTNNLFADSLHMPVCTNAGGQQHAIVVKSYPDSGYFIIWEDDRNITVSKKDIYAQKYDKNGVRLWTTNGLPVVNGPNDQHFTWPSNEDYRNRSVAATDSAGGFYITYTDDSLDNNTWQRMCVQHMKSDGNPVFPGPGYVVAQTPIGENSNFSQPQLIADDNGGFYISYIKNFGNDYIYVYCYKEQGGAMTLYGGGLVNYNGQQQRQDAPCIGASRSFISYPTTIVNDYNIWPDLQGGCSVVMAQTGNDAEQGKMLCYNRVWKAKKDATVTRATLFPTGDPNTAVTNYTKGQVDILYKLTINNLNDQCSSSGNSYFWVNDLLISNGYLLLDQGGYDYNYPKGTTLTTTGNINSEIIAFTKRSIDANNVISNFVVRGIAQAVEKYDSVPYQRASYNDPNNGYNPVAPAQMNRLGNFSDTLLAPGVYYNDFSLSGGGGEAYCAGLMGMVNNAREVRLQHLAVERQTVDSFAIGFKASSNQGELIGKELSTGSANTDIQYDLPFVAVDQTRDAVFYVREYSRYIRVSSVINGAQLGWGAMGKPIGTPFVKGTFANPDLPIVVLDPLNGSGVVAWQDSRNLAANTAPDIFMRHLDSINVVNYVPAVMKLQKLMPGVNLANPAVLLGSSKKFSTIEAYNSNEGTTSPVVEILDNYDLGAVAVNVYENPGPQRAYNGKAYLDRNYTIHPQNNPNGAATVNVRLFFTTAEFDALKAADPTISDPGSLGVVKQPNATGLVPDSYVPVAGESVIAPASWKAVNGGYYIEIAVTGFSNFFIQQSIVNLPVTWLGVQAQWTDKTHAIVSWQVADQQNVKDYSVQHSFDGMVYKDACVVNASDITAYSCVVPAGSGGKNYYRVLQQDVDGKKNYSKIVVLQSAPTSALSAYPNPAKDRLYITGLKDLAEISIIDVSGRLMGIQMVTAATNYVNISQLPAGIYIIRLVGNNDIQNIQFIKQ